MGRNKEAARRIARERIEILFQQAEERFDEYPQLADRYVKLAWRIFLKTRTRFPQRLKRRFCRRCFSFWVPNRTCRVRNARGKVTITCLKCNYAKRIPLVKEKSAKKEKKRVL